MTGCNHSQVVCAAGPILFHLEVKEGKIVQSGDTTLEHEIACIDITPCKLEILGHFRVILGSIRVILGKFVPFYVILGPE